jgi:hypothetical protein
VITKLELRVKMDESYVAVTAEPEEVAVAELIQAQVSDQRRGWRNPVDLRIGEQSHEHPLEEEQGFRHGARLPGGRAWFKWRQHMVGLWGIPIIVIRSDVLWVVDGSDWAGGEVNREVRRVGMRQHDASGNIWATIESISVAEDPDFVRVLSWKFRRPTITRRDAAWIVKGGVGGGGGRELGKYGRGWERGPTRMTMDSRLTMRGPGEILQMGWW